MILPINPPKQVTVTPAVPAKTVEASELTIVTISDNTVDNVTAVVNVDGYDLVLILWGDDTVPTYTQIGNWTQDQANARILELI
jgi:hypothetical protein